MLFSIDSGKYIDSIPHENEYNLWINRLSIDELNAIIDQLTDMIDGDEIHTSSWMPGGDWGGTVFHPIYEKSCLLNEEMSGLCFGLILWAVLMDRDDVWGFGRYEKDGTAIAGMTYFKLVNPPPR